MFKKTARAKIKTFGDRDYLSSLPIYRIAAYVPVAQFSDQYLYCVSEAIHSHEFAGPNENFDAFEAQELLASYPTFVAAGVYKDHNNQHSKDAIGICLDAWPMEGDPVPGVDVLMAVSKVKAPEECALIETGELKETSMGVVVGEAICSVCGTIAHDADEFCNHISSGMKGQEINGQLCFEYNRNLHFFENTLISPWNRAADPDAFIKQRLAGRTSPRRVEAQYDKICRQLDYIYKAVGYWQR